MEKPEINPGWENQDFADDQKLSTGLKYRTLVCDLESDAIVT